jgi:hypothetical protein
MVHSIDIMYSRSDFRTESGVPSKARPDESLAPLAEPSGWIESADGQTVKPDGQAKAMNRSEVRAQETDGTA